MDQTLFRSEVQQPVTIWTTTHMYCLNSYSFASAAFSFPSVASLLASASKVFCLNSLKRQSQAISQLEQYRDNPTKSLLQPPPCCLLPFHASEKFRRVSFLSVLGSKSVCPVLPSTIPHKSHLKNADKRPEHCHGNTLSNIVLSCKTICQGRHGSAKHEQTLIS